MINAGKPSVDEEKLYRDAARNRDCAARLLEISDHVFSRYRQYVSGLGVCATGQWSDHDSELLKGNVDTAAVTRLRPAIFDSTQWICYLCGNNRAGHVDHYLPRKHYPEFSILASNLMPACSYCNTIKGSKCSEVGGPQYFHSYLMKLPQEQFINVSLSFSETVVVEYFVDNSIPSVEVGSIAQQFADLKLAEMYTFEAVGYMNEQRNSYYQCFRSGGPQELQASLIRDARSVTAARGHNHWRAVLLHALASDVTFCSGAFTLLGEEIPFDA